MDRIKAGRILTFILATMICVCVIFIFKDLTDYGKARREYKRIDYMITEENFHDSYKDQKEPVSYAAAAGESTSSYDALYEMNEDLAGILSVPALDMIYPVVRGRDNTDYLYKTFEGSSNPAGCLFMDYENSRDFTDPHTYIYGHNMKDGSMFGSLKRIVRESMPRDQVVAYITTRDKEYTYEMQEAEVVNIDEYEADTEGSDLLTLYTCWGNDKSKRLLVTFSRKDTISGSKV